MLKRFWLSYDFGIDGDYDGLYAWLDSLEAVECGDSFCSFQIETGDGPPETAVLRDIKKHVSLRKKDRVYLVWRRENGAVTGKFVAGRRRRASWAGYAVNSSEESEDAAE